MGVREITPNYVPKEVGRTLSRLRPYDGGTPSVMGNCLLTGDFNVPWNTRPLGQGRRYRKVAAEYAELSKAAADPHLGSYYLRIAEDRTIKTSPRVNCGHWKKSISPATPRSPLRRSSHVRHLVYKIRADGQSLLDHAVADHTAFYSGPTIAVRHNIAPTYRAPAPISLDAIGSSPAI
jgi:hypothetical protein